MDWFRWENLQETIDFPIKYGEHIDFPMKIMGLSCVIFSFFTNPLILWLGYIPWVPSGMRQARSENGDFPQLR